LGKNEAKCGQTVIRLKKIKILHPQKHPISYGYILPPRIGTLDGKSDSEYVNICSLERYLIHFMTYEHSLCFTYLRSSSRKRSSCCFVMGIAEEEHLNLLYCMQAMMTHHIGSKRVTTLKKKIPG